MADMHTPLPWHFYELKQNPDGVGYIRSESDNLEISHHGDMARSRAVNLANAELIVTAVNERSSLLARASQDAETIKALREQTAQLVWRGTDNGQPLVSLNTVLAMIDEARAALAGRAS